jgi:hypothetical protein
MGWLLGRCEAVRLNCIAFLDGDGDLLVVPLEGQAAFLPFVAAGNLKLVAVSVDWTGAGF